MVAGTAATTEAAKSGATVGAPVISTKVCSAARVAAWELRGGAEVAVEDAVEDAEAMVADGGA